MFYPIQTVAEINRLGTVLAYANLDIWDINVRINATAQAQV
jgi:hypothetical protein